MQDLTQYTYTKAKTQDPDTLGEASKIEQTGIAQSGRTSSVNRKQTPSKLKLTWRDRIEHLIYQPSNILFQKMVQSGNIC